MKNKKILKNEDGWTFMETLIVIAVVMVLTASVGFMAVGSLEKARIAGARSQIDSFCTALEPYYIDCGFYPSTDQGLSALKKKPDSEPVSDSWSGPYIMKDAPKDPWGHEYVYIQEDDGDNPYKIICYGADGKEGGEGKNADINSWEN